MRPRTSIETSALMNINFDIGRLTSEISVLKRSFFSNKYKFEICNATKIRFCETA